MISADFCFSSFFIFFFLYSFIPQFWSTARHTSFDMGLAEVLQWPSGQQSRRFLVGREREYSGSSERRSVSNGRRRSTGAREHGGGSSEGQQQRMPRQVLHKSQRQQLQQHHHQLQHPYYSYSPPYSPTESPPRLARGPLVQRPTAPATPPLRSPPSPSTSSSPLSLHRHTRRLASSVSSSSSSTHRRRSSRPIANMPPEYRHARSSSMSIANSSSRPTSSVMPRSPPSTFIFHRLVSLLPCARPAAATQRPAGARFFSRPGGSPAACDQLPVLYPSREDEDAHTTRDPRTSNISRACHFYSI